MWLLISINYFLSKNDAEYCYIVRDSDEFVGTLNPFFCVKEFLPPFRLSEAFEGHKINIRKYFKKGEFKDDRYHLQLRCFFPGEEIVEEGDVREKCKDISLGFEFAVEGHNIPVDCSIYFVPSSYNVIFRWCSIGVIIEICYSRDFQI